MPWALRLKSLSVAALQWAKGREGKVCRKASVAPAVFALSDRILLLWMEIWRALCDADRTPFPCVGAAWPGTCGRLAILAWLKVSPPPPPAWDWVPLPLRPQAHSHPRPATRTGGTAGLPVAPEPAGLSPSVSLWDPLSRKQSRAGPCENRHHFQTSSSHTALQIV